MVHVEIKSDLVALHRAFMEAKFHAPPSNEEVLVSPILARIANAVVEGIVEVEVREGRGSEAEAWSRWRDVGARPEIVALVVECARQSQHWSRMTREEKTDYVRSGLSPVLASPDVLSLLVDEVESGRR